MIRTILVFIAFQILLTSDCASGRINRDLVTGKLTQPGIWDFFIYEVADHDFKEYNSRPNYDREGDHDISLLYAKGNANYSKFILEYHKKYKDFRKKLNSWQFSLKQEKKPAFKLGDEKKFLRKALVNYRRIVINFPKDKHSDNLYFRIAMILYLEKNENMKIYIQKIFRLYPDSSLSERSQLLLANYLFETSNYKGSDKIYRRLFSSSDNKIRLYAKYISAWIDYIRKKNRSKFAQKLTEVVRIGRIQNEKLFGKYIINNALSDLVKIWDKPRYFGQALNFFNRIQKPEYYLMVLERSGFQYIADKKYEKAMSVLIKIIQTSEIYGINPKIHRKILKVYRIMGYHEKVIEIFRKMENMYLEDSAWLTKNRDQSEDIRNFMEKMLRKYALYLVNKTQLQSKNTFIYPIKLIEMYLKWFNKTSQSIKMRLILAKLQSKTNQHHKAGINFKKVSDASSEQSEIKYSTFKMSLEELKKSVWNDQTIRPSDPHPFKSPVIMPKDIEFFVKTLEEYVKKFHRNEDDIARYMMLAEIYYTYGYYQQSDKIWIKILSFKNANSFSHISAARLLKSYEIRKKWPLLLESCYRFLGSDMADNKDDKFLLEELIRKATFEYGRQKSRAKNQREAAEIYLKYHRIFPMGKDSDQALKKAFFLTSMTKDYSDQINLGNRFINEYPESDLLDEILVKQSDLYAYIYDFEKAANLLWRFIHKNPNYKDIFEITKTSSSYFYAAELPDKSAAVWYNFIRKNKGHLRINDAFRNLFFLLRQSGEKNQLTKLSAEYMNGVHKQDKFIKALAMVYLGMNSPAPRIGDLIREIINFDKEDRSELSEIFSEYILKKVAKLIRENGLKHLDFSQDIKKITSAQKKQSKEIEKLGRVVEILGHQDQILEVRFRIAVMYAEFSKKISHQIMGAGEKERFLLEKIAFEAQELAEKYFELVQNLIPALLNNRGKFVYAGMSSYKKRFRIPDGIALSPDFVSFELW